MRADVLGAIQRDCDSRIERWNRFLHIGVDFSFSEYDLEKFIDLDRNLLKAIDIDEGIYEAIANAIEVLEEMLGSEIRQKHFSQGENISQNSAAKTALLSSDLKEVADQLKVE